MFDRLIVGSSPIAVMHAVRYARGGEKVVLVEADPCLGGAWKKALVEGVGETECACHLIEFQGKAYRIIEDLIGVEFIPLVPQPVRIHPDGRAESYTSRRAILRSAVREWSLVIALAIVRALRINRGRNTSLTTTFQNACFNFRHRVMSLWRFRGIEGPNGGFEVFAERLGASLEEHGVEVVLGRVSRVSAGQGGTWIVALESGSLLTAHHIHVTESVHLSAPPSSVPHHEIAPTPYWHLVVSIKNEDVGNVNPYIHLPGDSTFHRITSLQPSGVHVGVQNRRCLLVQARVDPKQLADVSERLGGLLVRCGVLRPGGSVQVHWGFTESLVGVDSDAQFRSGEYDGSFHVMKTIGDLARCTLHNASLLV